MMSSHLRIVKEHIRHSILQPGCQTKTREESPGERRTLTSNTSKEQRQRTPEITQTPEILVIRVIWNDNEPSNHRSPGRRDDLLSNIKIKIDRSDRQITNRRSARSQTLFDSRTPRLVLVICFRTIHPLKGIIVMSLDHSLEKSA